MVVRLEMNRIGHVLVTSIDPQRTHEFYVQSDDDFIALCEAVGTRLDDFDYGTAVEIAREYIDSLCNIVDTVTLHNPEYIGF